MTLGGKKFISDDVRMTKEEYYKNTPKGDAKQVLHELKTMVLNAESFSDFESDFIKEIARCATKFGDEFRMTKSQDKIWQQLWAKYILPDILKNKTK